METLHWLLCLSVSQSTVVVDSIRVSDVKTVGLQDPWAGVNIEHISSNDACLSPCMEPNDLAMPEWITVGVEKKSHPQSVS